jgi:hypothetical protein
VRALASLEGLVQQTQTFAEEAKEKRDIWHLPKQKTSDLRQRFDFDFFGRLA